MKCKTLSIRLIFQPESLSNRKFIDLHTTETKTCIFSPSRIVGWPRMCDGNKQNLVILPTFHKHKIDDRKFRVLEQARFIFFCSSGKKVSE